MVRIVAATTVVSFCYLARRIAPRRRVVLAMVMTMTMVLTMTLVMVQLRHSYDEDKDQNNRTPQAGTAGGCHGSPTFHTLYIGGHQDQRHGQQGQGLIIHTHHGVK